MNKVLIWSGEHNAYWRPAAAGYTVRLSAAGIYDRAEAESLTSHCGPEKRIELETYPSEAITGTNYRDPVVAAHLAAEATSELLRFHREGPQLLGGPFGDVDVCTNLAEALLIAARIQRDHAGPDSDLNQLTGALERYLEWEGVQV